MNAPARQDAASVEIFAQLFRAIVDEMAWIILRSAHTTFVKETQDFGAALVSREGEVFAFPPASPTPLMGVPMHAGTHAVTDWEPGDVLITNDPYTTGGMVMHLNDIYLFKPIFVDGTLLCFAWDFIHCTDVGGYAPGSIDMQNTEIFQEGLRLRPVRLFRKGKLNQEVWNIVSDNCRIPSLNWGDIMACVAALGKAEQRVIRLAERYGVAEVERGIYATLDRTEQLARSVLTQIPKGEYGFVEFFEDDYTSDLPVRLVLNLISRGDGTIQLDYTGSDPQVRAAINLPTGNERRHPFLCIALTNFVATYAEGMHLNGGIMRCFDLVLPQASVVNASFPAAVGMRYSTAMRIHDLVLGALARAIPGRVPVSGSGAVAVVYISTSELGTAGRVVVANPVPGGSGGSPALDGISGTDYHIGFLRNVPVEVVEAEAPVVIRRFGLRSDSEGAGKRRGGFGIEYEFDVRHPSAVVVIRGKDRHRFSSWGANGGGAGATNGNTGTKRGGEPQDLGKRTIYRSELGETIRLWSGGGGGWGDPLEREPAMVLEDVASGLLSSSRAHDVYGVVITGGAVDAAATEAQRRHLAATRPPVPQTDFGVARTEWERVHGEAAERMAALLPRLPAGTQRFAQGEIYRRLHASGPGPYSAETTERMLNQLREELAEHLGETGS